jgi:hypothetical protein
VGVQACVCHELGSGSPCLVVKELELPERVVTVEHDRALHGATLPVIPDKNGSDAGAYRGHGTVQDPAPDLTATAAGSLVQANGPSHIKVLTEAARATGGEHMAKADTAGSTR